MLRKVFVSLIMTAGLIQTSVASRGFEIDMLNKGNIWDNLNIYIPKHKDIMTTIGEPHRADLSPENIHILVWNMYKGQNPSWAKDFKFLAENKDILMLQEMYLDEKMKAVFNLDIDHEYNIATSFIYRRENIRTGVATASSITASSVFYQQSKVREPVIGTPKMVIFTLFPIAGIEKNLLTINIHAINFVNSFGLARQITEIEKVMRRHDGPVIFAGDFNTWSLGKLAYLKRMAKRNNFKSVTFEKDERMRTFGNIIDYVFYRGLAVEKSKVWGKLEGADHKALDVTFSIK